jgi:hypothetical protein
MQSHIQGSWGTQADQRQQSPFATWMKRTLSHGSVSSDSTPVCLVYVHSQSIADAPWDPNLLISIDLQIQSTVVIAGTH